MYKKYCTSIFIMLISTYAHLNTQIAYAHSPHIHCTQIRNDLCTKILHSTFKKNSFATHQCLLYTSIY